ncbi:restriction endonuclease subunit S [Bisgaard Taxon 45]
MEKYTIGNACNITTGKLDANQAKLNGKYPFFTCAEFPDYIDEYAFDDDVVLIAGNNARGNFHVNRYSGKFNAYQRTYVLTAKENFDLDFIYYSLKLELKRLKERSQGSQTKFLTMPILKSIKLKELDLSTQQKIAQVLSTLDRKIALNQQINAELEKMAKTLYDYWFVQFDFPDENGNPYKSSGGKMVYNPELKREVPKGWEVKKLGEISSIKKGTLITEKLANTSGCIKVVSAGLDFSYFHDVANYPENTITVSASGANAGFINFWREPIFACDCTAITTENIGKTLYVLNFLKSVQEFIYQQARGSAQPHVYPKDIEKLNVVLPPISILEKFNDNLENSNSKITNNLKQTQKLTQLRDFLLPMLMNGQVDVVD